MSTFVSRVQVGVPAEFLFDWHARPGAFHRLVPPWEDVRLISSDGSVQNGARTVFDMRIGPIWRRWVAEHRHFESGRQFQDVQIQGPFARWVHTHRIEPVGKSDCTLEDYIEFELPFRLIGSLADRMIQRQLARTFDYRHRLTQNDVHFHWQRKDSPRMKVLVTGSTGLVGSRLVPFLTTGGDGVVRLVRKPTSKTDEIQWQPSTGDIDEESRLDGIDAVVHLAGENIATGRWTAKKKERIRESRVNGTRLLCESLAKLPNPPSVLVCASAIGFYGDRGDELLDETSEVGTGFLCDVCRDWEESCQPAVEAGIRVVNLRVGVVLSRAGGALKSMLMPFKFGLGGVVGSGRQHWSWIAIEDLLRTIVHCLQTTELSGPINAVSEQPVTNYEFTKSLGAVLRRPTVFPLPAFAARLVLGEMANELLLASSHVSSARLQASGFEFLFPNLEAALKHELGIA